MTKQHNILIVEDEILIANYIKQIIERYNFKCVAIAKSYTDALKVLNKTSVDIVLLDISLFGNKTGVDLAHYINENYQIPFVYLTSYTNRKMLEALKETKPLGYFSKPVQEHSLIINLQLIISNFKAKKQLFTFHISKTQYTIDLDLLLYIKSDHIYVTIVLKDRSFQVRSSLKSILDLFPNRVLTQINRGVAVNPTHVYKKNSKAVFIDDKEFLLSKIFSDSQIK